jgi:hypothetical protein
MTEEDSRPDPAVADTVAAAAAELYGLKLGEFTAGRTERARKARADDDRGAAAVIGKLPKPSVVAWLANQLIRQYPSEISSLLDLGGSLRAATAALDADELRQLSRQQRDAVSALLDRARALAEAAGQAFSDSTDRGLADTLHAAMADESAARQLTAGQLAAGLSRTGFPGIDDGAETDLTAAFAPTPVPAAAGTRPAAAGTGGRKAAGGKDKEPRTEKEARAAEAHRQQLDGARRAEAAARRDADDAAQDRDSAQAALASAETTVRQAAQTIDRLQAELDAALGAQADAGRAQRQARKEVDRADRTARQAERRLAEATARRADVERRR